MSLTNDMLKNLDKRRLSEHMGEPILNGLHPVITKKHAAKKILYSLLLLVIVIGALEIIYFKTYFRKAPAAAPKIISEQIINIEKPAISVPLHKGKAIAVLPARETKPAIALNQPTANASTTKVLSSEAAANRFYSKPASVSNKAIGAVTTNATIDLNPAAHNVLVKTPNKPSIDDQASGDYQLALDLIAQGQAAQAETKLANLLELVPSYEQARLTFATLLLRDNNINVAKSVLSEGLALQPQSIPLTMLYARALVMQNYYSQAEKSLLSLTSIPPDDVAYLELFANIEQHLGKTDQALFAYQKLLAHDPQNARWLTSYAMTLEQAGEFKTAVTIYKKAAASPSLTPLLQSYVIQRIKALRGE